MLWLGCGYFFKGKVSLKVVPLPSLLTKLSSPFMMETKFLVTAKPMPFPLMVPTLEARKK